MTPVQQASQAGNAAAGAIRSLNHLTLPADGAPGLREPGDADGIIADLAVMTRRLPQLLSQLADWLDGEWCAGRVGDDRRTDPTPTVAIVIDALGRAAIDAAELAETLKSAQNACAHLTGEG